MREEKERKSPFNPIIFFKNLKCCVRQVPPSTSESLCVWLCLWSGSFRPEITMGTENNGELKHQGTEEIWGQGTFFFSLKNK